MLDIPYYMPSAQIRRCVELAKRVFPVTDKTRVVIMNKPLTLEQKRERQKEIESLDPATVTEIETTQRSVTLEITWREDVGFAYVQELDVLLIRPKTEH